jgi:hypothetical protein
VGKYLHTEGRAEQRGRAEDGKTDLKKKWQQWPGSEDKKGGSTPTNMPQGKAPAKETK